MLKIEYIWRDLLDRVIGQKNPDFTLTELAQKYSLSTSLVNHSLIPLRSLRLVKISKTVSGATDWEMLLFYWATRRSLRKDIVYATFSPLPVDDREGLMPPAVIPTGYTAFRGRFNQPPADYDHIYFYSDQPEAVKKRFPPSQRPPNHFIIHPDPFLLKSNQVGLAQLFADLWNLPEWYAKDFQEACLLKIKTKLGL